MFMDIHGYPWISWLLNIHGYPRKNDMDMDGIFLIHGKPDDYTYIFGLLYRLIN